MDKYYVYSLTGNLWPAASVSKKNYKVPANGS